MTTHHCGYCHDCGNDVADASTLVTIDWATARGIIQIQTCAECAETYL